jgi:hypothetical protein
MGPRLIALAALLAKRQGPVVARALLRSGQAWLADPANESTKRALLAQLDSAARVAGGAAGLLSARLAREVEKRRVSVGAWERDLMSLRYEVADMAPGPVRDAAIDAYAAQASAGIHLVTAARDVEKARAEVIAALDSEERMLRAERLPVDEKKRAILAVARARTACAEHGASPARA